MMTVKELLESAERNLRFAENHAHPDSREAYARIADGYTRIAEAKMKALRDGFKDM